MTVAPEEEREYLVIVEHTFAYRVSATSAKEAARQADEGIDLDYRTSECLFSTVENVVAPGGHWADADLRQDTA